MTKILEETLKTLFDAGLTMIQIYDKLRAQHPDITLVEVTKKYLEHLNKK